MPVLLTGEELPLLADKLDGYRRGGIRSGKLVEKRKTWGKEVPHRTRNIGGAQPGYAALGNLHRTTKGRGERLVWSIRCVTRCKKYRENKWFTGVALLGGG